MLQNGKTQDHMSHMVSSHILWPLLGVFKKICEVALLDLMTNISVNNVYVKYMFIYPCNQSKLCLFQNSMIFPWVTDPKFNDFSMIISFLLISRTFHEIQWFFHDLETDLNFNDFSRAVGTLYMYQKIKMYHAKHYMRRLITIDAQDKKTTTFIYR